MAKQFSDLNEREILALAISSELEDATIYANFSERLKTDFPDTAEVLQRMAKEENGHAQRLTDALQKQFGEHIPFIRRGDVKGFFRRKPLWLANSLTLDQVRKEVEVMEIDAMRFYRAAAEKADNPEVKTLLETLAGEEEKHEILAEHLVENLKFSGALKKEDEAQRRQFILQVIQPGLAGLMDGSVSTLAPVFAAAFVTEKSWDAFIVGMAASLGAGISMGFAEALSDDGVISGRGRPVIRGIICGLMTTLGGVGHTIPFLISDFQIATIVAVIIVAIELAVISWVRHKYMDTPLLAAAFQVVVGGVLVLITGILLGSA